MILDFGPSRRGRYRASMHKVCNDVHDIAVGLLLPNHRAVQALVDQLSPTSVSSLASCKVSISDSVHLIEGQQCINALSVSGINVNSGVKKCNTRVTFLALSATYA